jgi:hypothetical protein
VADVRFSTTIRFSVFADPQNPERALASISESPLGASEWQGVSLAGLEKPLNWEYGKLLYVLSKPGEDPDDAAAKIIGKNLYDVFFSGNVGESFRTAMSSLPVGGRLRLAIDASRELVEVPWELLHDDRDFLLSQECSIIRVVSDLPPSVAYFGPLTRVAVITATPDFDAAPHVAEFTGMLQALGVDTVLCLDPDRGRLSKFLQQESVDAIYLLGHGRQGNLLLQPPSRAPDLLAARDLANWLPGANDPERRRVNLIYLNSCSTGEGRPEEGAFSGVAQRLMLGRRVGTVVAMQAKIGVHHAFAIAQNFFETAVRGGDPEAALAHARTQAGGVSARSIPVLYTHLRGPEDFARNGIKCLLSAETGKSRFGIVLASFGMGVRLDGQGEMTTPEPGTYHLPATVPITVSVKPHGTFVYPGETYARDDVESAREIESLLFQIAGPQDVRLYPSPEGPGVTHWFLFGSLSSRYVTTVLKTYSPRFEFRYLADSWCLDELDADGKVIEPTNKVQALYRLGQRDYANQPDIGIIEKITDPHSGTLFFIIAGLGSRATRGCGLYLASKWKRLLADYGSRDFGVILEFPAGMPPDYAEHRPHRQNATSATGMEPSRAAASKPPSPPPVVHPDDPQKGRWGGVQEHSGRGLGARLQEYDDEEFYVDLFVHSTDGSPLIGPVIFHLHDTYARGIVKIKRIQNNEAVLESVNSAEVFTSAAQARDKNGAWVGLEYDLALLPGLPKRFGGPGVKGK